MPVNLTLSHYSDLAFSTAVAIYVLAMIFYLVEYAFGQQRVAKSQQEEIQELVAVGSGTTIATTPPVDDAPGRIDLAQPRRAAERFGRMAVALTILGSALHITSIALRGVAEARWPWGNMYEFGSAICLMAVLGWLTLLRKQPIRPLGGFVLLPVVVLMFISGTVLYAQAAPVQPALQSYWLVIHVTAASISGGGLLLPGVASVLYLLQQRDPGPGGTAGKAISRLPHADVLDRLAYRVTRLIFPLWTFAIMTGAIWAASAWGKFWSWDPKETVAFVAWVVYAAYLHARATAGWRGRRAALLNILGFAVMIFNLFFINLVTAGMHSYAGVG